MVIVWTKGKATHAVAELFIPPWTEASLLAKVVFPLIFTSQVAAEYIAPVNRNIGGYSNAFTFHEDCVAFVSLPGSREVIRFR